jgi:hypothetical protein
VYVAQVSKKNKNKIFSKERESFGIAKKPNYRTVCKRNHWKEHIVYAELVEKRNKTSDLIKHYRTVCKRNHWKEHIVYVELVSKKKQDFLQGKGELWNCQKTELQNCLQKKPLERAHSVCRIG